MSTDNNQLTEVVSNIPQTGDNLSQYNSEDKYNSVLNQITEEVNQNIQFANESSDWKEIRNRLNISKDKLKGLFLKDEDNRIILEKINNCIELVNKRQAEEIERLDKESNDNYNSVIDKVKENIEKSKETKDYKHARELLVAAQELFKNLKLNRSHRNELTKLINNAYDELSTRQIEERENYEMECIENYHTLKKIVENAVEFSKTSPIFAKSREALINAQNAIKGKKLKKEQREELYQVIRNAFEDVNKRQDEDRSNFDTETTENYNKLRKIVDEAIEFAKNTEEYSVAREQLINAQNAIKGVKLKREQRDELYANIRSIFEEINSKQTLDRSEFEKECNENYNKLTQKVDDCFAMILGLTDFKLIRETLITVQSEVKLAKLLKDQRNELFARLREAFTNFDKKKEEFFNKRKEERKLKLNEIKYNLLEKINRMKELIENDNKLIEELKKKIDESNHDELIVKDAQTKITNIENRIKERNSSIENSNQKLQEIEKELSELN